MRRHILRRQRNRTDNLALHERIDTRVASQSTHRPDVQRECDACTGRLPRHRLDGECRGTANRLGADEAARAPRATTASAQPAAAVPARTRGRWIARSAERRQRYRNSYRSVQSSGVMVRVPGSGFRVPRSRVPFRLRSTFTVRVRIGRSPLVSHSSIGTLNWNTNRTAEPGTRNPELGTRNSELGTRNPETEPERYSRLPRDDRISVAGARRVPQFLRQHPRVSRSPS